MNKGRSIVEIAKELERQIETRKDYLAQTDALEMTVDVVTEDGETGPPKVARRVGIEGMNGGTHHVRDLAHEQIAEQTDIPRAYYKRMLETEPDLLATNVNRWWKKTPSRRMIRTLDGDVRAVLSSRYRPLDNMDLAEAVLPVLQEKGVKVESAELTDRRLYIKAILMNVEIEVRGTKRKNDIVQSGIVISNSEVGCGAVRIEPFAYFLACTNGMIGLDSSLRTHHVGKGNDVDGIQEFLRDETKQASDKAFWMKVRDVVGASFNEVHFRTMVGRLEEVAGMKIESTKLEKVVEVTTSRLALPEGSRGSILRNLIEGGDLSRYGLLNAVTAVANDTKDYELATEFERAGGKILEMPAPTWKEISTAGVN
jgi:hypothetical protein